MSRGLHRFAVFLVLGIIGLIGAGGLVKSLEAGLSVPDWPTSYGGLNPPNWWRIETVRAEHGHRLFAGTIALLTFVLAAWTQRVESRRWLKRLAWAAFATVLLQALLGGLTVLFFLPPAISISHAGLAQLFLCLVVTVAVATSAGWSREGRLDSSPVSRSLATLSAAATVLVYLQILLGALVRHTGSGLAIPDFPTMFGGWWPDRFGAGIAVHFGHRLGALVVTVVLLTLVARLWRRRGVDRLLAGGLASLLALQVSLGATIIWTERAVLPNTLHVPTGACLFALTWWVTLRNWRRCEVPARGDSPVEGEAAVAA